MRSKWSIGVRRLVLGYVALVTAVRCGETAGRGSSETNFQRCTTDSECPAGEHCEAELCRDVDAAVTDGSFDAGRGCSPGNIAECTLDISCLPTWEEATTHYTRQCPSTTSPYWTPYQVVCGEYNAIMSLNVDVVTVHFYDQTSGAIVGSYSAGKTPPSCTAYTSDFVLPDVTKCTAPPGVDCNTTSDAAHGGDGGPGTLCSSDIDCASTLKCCYPCGVPDCQNECMVAPGGQCPLIP